MSILSHVKNILYKPYYHRIKKGESIIDRAQHKVRFETHQYSTIEKLELNFDNYQIIGGDQPKWAEYLIGEHFIDQPFYSLQKNATLLAEGATVITENNEILLDSIYNHTYSLLRYGNRKILATRKLYKIERTIDLAISLVSPLSYSLLSLGSRVFTFDGGIFRLCI